MKSIFVIQYSRHFYHLSAKVFSGLDYIFEQIQPMYRTLEINIGNSIFKSI